MAKTKAVQSRKTDDGTVYDFTCPYPTGCGADTNDPEATFTSVGWADKEHARARAEQHMAEHKTGTPMQDQVEFEVERGLRPKPVPTFNPDDDVEI